MATKGGGIILWLGENKQPLSVILGKGKSKHLTKTEVETRSKQEASVKGFTDKIKAPSYLSKKQKEEFIEISSELIRLGIFSNLDVDGLARYIDSKSQYIQLLKEIKKLKPTEMIEFEDGRTKTIANDYPKLMRTKNTLFNVCRAAASDLGLIISLRLKLVLPTSEDDNKPIIVEE